MIKRFLNFRQKIVKIKLRNRFDSDNSVSFINLNVRGVLIILKRGWVDFRLQDNWSAKNLWSSRQFDPGGIVCWCAISDSANLLSLWCSRRIRTRWACTSRVRAIDNCNFGEFWRDNRWWSQPTEVFVEPTIFWFTNMSDDLAWDWQFFFCFSVHGYSLAKISRIWLFSKLQWFQASAKCLEFRFWMFVLLT